MFEKYKTIIFDCDGVVLNSNKIKTDAFYKIALPYGKSIAEDFQNYHKNNGGISRYKKFDYLINELIPKLKYKQISKNLLLEKFEELTFNDLKYCEVAENLDKLKLSTKNINWLIVSGADQNQIKSILKFKKIESFFNSGIFGSPDTKFQIISREIKKNNIKYPVLYFGDSKLDYIVSKFFEIDFIFLSNWTEFKDWKKFFKNKKVQIYLNFNQIITE